MGKPPTMKTACLIVLISIASCVGCYPSKPLNERSTELAWQAWLLVDQSNRQGDLSLTRRKITPKSVFIAPKFTIESLPACAEGYKSDPMGRCVRIIKLNESIHLDFLVASLSDRFPGIEEQTEEVSTPGPLQLNVPLEGDSDEGANETVAIVVTPSSILDRSTTVKVDVKRHNTGDKFDVEDIAAILRVKPESVEMTTIAELTTTMMTTMRSEEETTTLQTTTETASTEMGETSTMPLEGDAIFFQVRV